MGSDKFYFYAASGQIYYYDSYRNVYLEDGTCVYGGALGLGLDGSLGSTFYLDGTPHWFDLEGLNSNGVDGLPYRVLTWQNDPALFDLSQATGQGSLFRDDPTFLPPRKSGLHYDVEPTQTNILASELYETRKTQDEIDHPHSPARSVSSSILVVPSASRESSQPPLFERQSGVGLELVDMWKGDLVKIQQDSMRLRPLAKANKAGRLRCPYCDKVFRRPTSLDDHLNVHSGEKPHICPFKGCNTGFATKLNMKRHFLTHRVGQLQSYGLDAIFESETIPQPTTSNTGKAPRPIRTYNSKSYLSGRFRISEDESVAPPKRIEGFAFSTRESAITPSRGRSESGFDNDDLTQSGTNMMSEKHNSPSPEQTVPSPPSGLTQVDLEDDPMTDRTDLPDTPIIDHLIRPDLAELTIHNKTYFYASNRFYYFDNHRKVYSEESGTLMYDGASAVRTNEHCTLDFHLEGVPYWFDSDKLWSRDAKDKPYLVHTWQGESERIDCHMSMPEMLHHLLHHGCVNLSSLMDSRQNTAIIKNGGGFGDIWMGELNDGTQVAIKAWRGSFIEQCDYKTLKRAAREIYFWSRLKHENIHPLMGVIIFKGHYLGMISHWMENGNVYEYMRKNPNFDRYQMGVHIASGLACMHQCNAVHGDLKACNILVSSDGVAMLTDFGLSTISEAGLAFSETTKTQARSMRWASPELLVEGTRSSKPSDIYALGMTILEIFTGTVPYPQCQTDIQVMLKLFQGVLPIRPLEEFKDNSRDNRLWELLESCWKREPDARPSAEQVVETEHIRTHTGEKPEKCPFMGCTAGFSTKPNMKRHFATHRAGELEDYKPGIAPKSDLSSQSTVGRQPTGTTSGRAARNSTVPYEFHYTTHSNLHHIV